jgi:4-amino-4-deoxy-L-arabinose transferase-like glycosyltransferase
VPAASAYTLNKDVRVVEKASTSSACSSPPRGLPCRIVAVFLILGVTAIRLIYLARYCPLDLAPDEAHYWDWSRHLDWSYYSKGPLIAWLIRASCEIFGPLSHALIGSEMPAVRLPAVLCGGLLLAGLYVLTVQAFRSEKLALAVTVLSLTLPVLSAGAVLMTIDAPYTCCWAWSLVMGHRAVFTGSRWAWPVLGVIVAAGTLAKYTMILWLPSFGLFLLASSEHRRLLLSSGFWSMAAVSMLCCLPIAVWNAQHGWVSLLHMRVHAGLSEEGGMRWLGPLSFIGSQFALLLGYWILAWIGGIRHFAAGRSERAQASYLWWTSAPVFVFFLLASVKNGGGEPNWPIAAYLSGMVLAVAWIADQMQASSRIYRLVQMAALLAFSVLGLSLTVLLHRTEWLRPALLHLAGPASTERPFPLRRWDPTCRLRGWRTLAMEVDRICRSYSHAGVEPVLAVTYWNVAGELAFYCQGHPTVYSLGLAFGDRHSQYDLWRPNPIADTERFYGRTFVIVGYDTPALAASFDWIEPARVVTHGENGVPVSSWAITVAHGFRGIGLPQTSRY